MEDYLQIFYDLFYFCVLKNWTVLEYRQTEQLEIKVQCKEKSPPLPQQNTAAQLALAFYSKYCNISACIYKYS